MKHLGSNELQSGFDAISQYFWRIIYFNIWLAIFSQLHKMVNNAIYNTVWNLEMLLFAWTSETILQSNCNKSASSMKQFCVIWQPQKSKRKICLFLRATFD